MRSLYIDVATTSMWNWDDKDPLSPERPHLVRLAWAEVHNEDLVNEACHLIRPPAGVRMAVGDSSVSGIYDHHLQGPIPVKMADALTELANALGRLAGGGEIVAFSWGFVSLVLNISFHRVGFLPRDWPEEVYDLMRHGARLVGKRHRAGGPFLFPKFRELTEKAMSTVLQPSGNPVHDGLARLKALRPCHVACLTCEREAGLID